MAVLAGEGQRAGARLAEELQEAALAVGFVILLFEGALVELLQAKGAHEMLGVELLGHGGDAAARDGLLAARAQRAAPFMVVDLTVRLPVVLEEAAIYEGREALLQKRRERGLGAVLANTHRTLVTLIRSPACSSFL